MRRAALIALAFVFVLPGCGGGSRKPLSKAEYASKADAICGKYNQQIKSFANPKNLSDLAKVADKTLPILDQAIGDLSTLEPPASEKALSDQWLTQVNGLKSDLQEIRDKAKAGDMQGVQAVVPKATDHNAKSNALAGQLGMSVCNRD
ncbi:MAG: hypothetical protein M3R37_12110 [Actinomycetota bacterium]|nr:hypothetical protein [Actinomycetota bacterium]